MKNIILTCSLFAAGSLCAAVPFRIGIAGYTFCKEGLDKGLSIMRQIDCRSLCHKDFFISYDASDAEIAAFKEKLAKAGVVCDATGPLYAKDEATARKQFAFAKKLGVKVLVGVPYEVPEGEKDQWGPNRRESDAMLDVIEKLVKEYDVVYAIHNHGPDIPNLFPTAQSVWNRIKNRDKRIGLCFDIGHDRRAGSDTCAAIKTYADRIYDVHIKNILLKKDANGFPGNFAVPGPRGDLDIPSVFRALAEAGYAGACHIEYETDFEDNAMGLAESMGYYRGVADAIKLPAKMQPAPDDANTLTESEKSEGFRLLWDGKTLDGWLAVKSGCKEPPAKGWVIAGNTLTMRPVNGITDDGNWFPLPPEDQKLGGGGDIVTAEKFRDFDLRFDFRVTAKANSGVKYFYDETLNGGTCEEYQILESGHPDYNKGKDGNRKIASLYDIIAAPKANEVEKPVGQWNSGRIVAKGAKVEHWLNGVKVLEYTRFNPGFKALVKASKYATWGKDKDGNPQDWGETVEGRILLQDHSDSTVSFCNLKIREL